MRDTYNKVNESIEYEWMECQVNISVTTYWLLSSIAACGQQIWRKSSEDKQIHRQKCDSSPRGNKQ